MKSLTSNSHSANRLFTAACSGLGISGDMPLRGLACFTVDPGSGTGSTVNYAEPNQYSKSQHRSHEPPPEHRFDHCVGQPVEVDAESVAMAKVCLGRYARSTMIATQARSG